MKRGHIPIRKCMACNQHKPKSEFIRIVKRPSESLDASTPRIEIDLVGKEDGRGAYICRDSKCLKIVQKSRRLERCLSSKIDSSVYEMLEKEVEKSGE